MGYDFLGLSLLALSTIALGAVLTMIINVVFLVTAYILTGIGLSTLAKNNGHSDKAILAWIPIANLYLLAIIAGDSKLFSINIKSQYLGITLVLLKILGAFNSSSSLIWGISVMALLYGYYTLFKKISGNSAVLLSILSIIPIFRGIFLYINRNAQITDYDYEIL